MFVSVGDEIRSFQILSTLLGKQKLSVSDKNIDSKICPNKKFCTHLFPLLYPLCLASLDGWLAWLYTRPEEKEMKKNQNQTKSLPNAQNTTLKNANKNRRKCTFSPTDANRTDGAVTEDIQVMRHLLFSLFITQLTKSMKRNGNL